MKKIRYNENWTFYNDIRKDEETEVTLPHDAMLTEKRSAGTKNAAATGFYPGGRYVYRKKMGWDSDWQGKSILLEFEGVYQKPSVYLNNELIGCHHYGYTGFYIDLTGKLLDGGENELKVIADNTQAPNSRWYSGSGIYRNVNLLIGESTYIRPDGIFAVTEGIEPARLRVRTDLSPKAEEAVSDGRLKLVVSVYPADDEPSGSPVVAAEGRDCIIEVTDALLWSEDEPNLYEVRAELIDPEGQSVDTDCIRTGIRMLKWSAAEGMTINGRRILLRGGCIHHDNGILGACAYDEAEYRKIRILKDAGFNAIRSAHNPCSKALLNACDELGVYVMDEAFDQWEIPNTAYDYSLYFDSDWQEDLGAMIKKDRSHPSVIMYSVGNEIPDTGKPEGTEISRMLTEFCHKLDDSRPALSALNPVVSSMGGNGAAKGDPTDIVDPYEESNSKSRASASLLANIIATVAPFISKTMGKPDKVENKLGPIMETMDIVGLNYSENCYEPMRTTSPDRILVGSETHPQDVCDRWPYIEEHPHVLGDFMWTAFDYLGEAGIGVPIYGKKSGGFNRPYPCVSGGCGVIDLLGHMEAEAYLTRIAWHLTDEPYIGVLPVNHTGEKRFFGMWRGTDAEDSWSWYGMEGCEADIEVYGSGAETELFVDGRSLGRKKLQSLKAFYHTIYAPGSLKAVNYDSEGRILGESELVSAEGDTIIAVTPESSILPADRGSITYIDVVLTDENKRARRMLEDREITVTIEGPAELIAMGSAAPMNEEQYGDSHHRTDKGRLGLYIRSTGTEGSARIRCSAEGCEDAVAVVEFKEGGKD